MDELKEALSEIAEHMTAIKEIMARNPAIMSAEVWNYRDWTHISLYENSGFVFDGFTDDDIYRRYYGFHDGVKVTTTAINKGALNG